MANLYRTGRILGNALSAIQIGVASCELTQAEMFRISFEPSPSTRPSPQGEGESSAAPLKIRVMDWPDGRTNNQKP
jgi:hypothetical protein